MAITSFANTDVSYPDGQSNKEPIPDEILDKGFVPPVRMPDGSISAGVLQRSRGLDGRYYT